MSIADFYVSNGISFGDHNGLQDHLLLSAPMSLYDYVSGRGMKMRQEEILYSRLHEEIIDHAAEIMGWEKIGTGGFELDPKVSYRRKVDDGHYRLDFFMETGYVESHKICENKSTKLFDKEISTKHLAVVMAYPTDASFGDPKRGVTGTIIKWFRKKRYGFVRCGYCRYFLHRSGLVSRDTEAELRAGTKIMFDTESDERRAKDKAVNVRILREDDVNEDKVAEYDGETAPQQRLNKSTESEITETANTIHEPADIVQLKKRKLSDC